MKINVKSIEKKVTAEKRRAAAAAKRAAKALEKAEKIEQQETEKKFLKEARRHAARIVKAEIKDYLQDDRRGPMYVDLRLLQRDFYFPEEIAVKALKELRGVKVKEDFIPEEQCNCGGDGCQLNHSAHTNYYIIWDGQPPYTAKYGK